MPSLEDHLAAPFCEVHDAEYRRGTEEGRTCRGMFCCLVEVAAIQYEHAVHAESPNLHGRARKEHAVLEAHESGRAPIGREEGQPS
jgi:hypothetical protein